jgi:transposase
MLQKKGEPAVQNITIGMDLGDKNNVVCVLDSSGKEILSDTIENRKESLNAFFLKFKGATVAIEAGTHSPWISRHLTLMGCDVLVGNPRKLRVIWDSDDKADLRDAKMLAQIAQFNRSLLYPITHRGKQAQVDLEILQSRDILVKSRTQLVNHVRGSVKSLGERLPACGSEVFHRKVVDSMPLCLQGTLTPILEIIGKLTEQIKEFDHQIEVISKECYPETQLLRAIKGVGPLTALAFVLILEDPSRFKKSRQVGKFVGLVPRRDQSGETDKQLRITKAGNPYLRRLLVGAAQYILGPFSEDCNLRRFGLRLAARGGKNAKKRAIVAVARKLAVLLHRLWKNGEMYAPLYKVQKEKMAKAA